MPLSPDLRSSRRWWLYMLCVGALLTACDFTPVQGVDRGPGDQRQPVETVTALEIDAADLRVDDPSVSAGRDTASPPGVPGTKSR
jgi:hypothetical protein